MASLEQVFIKEFKRNIRSMSISKNIYEVPLPKALDEWGISNSEIYAIKGIVSSESGYFSGLNNSLVAKPATGVAIKKRKVDLVNRNFARDKDGRFIYEDVKIPKDSVVVISDKNLNLPYGYKCAEEGFGYIDFVMNGLTKEFLYYVPKKYLYLTHQTALALSVKNMKNFCGKGYVTWKYGTIYLHVIPYRHTRSYVGTKILKTGHTLNYEKEVKEIVDYWIANDIIPNISLCNTIAEGNLVLKDTIRGYDDFEPIEEFSLKHIEIYGSSEYSSED